jgi:type I restriction enzyme S subunit
MSGWQEFSLGQVYSFSSGLSKSRDEFGYGYPFVSFKDVFENFFLPKTLGSLANTTEKERQTCSVRRGDVFLTRTSETQEELGMSSVALTDYPNATFNGFTKRLRSLGTVEILPEYAGFYFRSPRFRALVTSMSSITTRASLNNGMLSALKIVVPPLSEQKAIAAVLSSLDDKIDLLHRQSLTLEAMAETLFRQWFIEEAQEDWEEKPLSSVANFLNGLACQKFRPKNDLEKLPVLKIKELSSGISELSDWATSEVKLEYIVENGDVIFAWSASLMVKVWDGERCVLNQHLFKVTSNDFPKWFYLMWCKHHLGEFISISSSHATTMGHIKRSDLDTAKVLVPSPEEIKAMSEKMTPLLDKQIAISKQRKTLEKLRDTLLPKLMSGEVRVRID